MHFEQGYVFVVKIFQIDQTNMKSFCVHIARVFVQGELLSLSSMGAAPP